MLDSNPRVAQLVAFANPPQKRRSNVPSIVIGILGCLLTQVGSAQAQIQAFAIYPEAKPPYYRVRYEREDGESKLAVPVNFTIWIPAVDRLRGIVVHQHGCGTGSCKSGLTGAYDLHWQQLAKKHDCVLLSPAYEAPDGVVCQRWCDPRNGSGAAFQRALRDLGEQSGHSELQTVPWALWGHSGGASWVGGMLLLHPERVVAAWLRSGAPRLQPDPERPDTRPFKMNHGSLNVPVMCNLGTREGVTNDEGRFAKVWPNVRSFFEHFRSRKGLIGVAVDPLTSHECGNQRYLAIPWFDTCLSLRLRSDESTSMHELPSDAGWLSEPTGRKVTPASDASGDPLKLGWLPNEVIARKWMEYVNDTSVSDDTPPPMPTNVSRKGNVIHWEAEADLESGIARFHIERDGKIIATIPSKPNNKRGRTVFQGLQYSDTPLQPLVKMQFVDDVASPTSSYRVIAENTVGLMSGAAGR